MSILFESIPDGESLSFYYSDLHKVFYEARVKTEYRELLKDFWFSGSSVSPFSNELSIALGNLQIAALSRKNPDLVEYSKTIQFRDTYEILTKDVDEDILSKVKLMCNEIIINLKKESEHNGR